MFPGKKDGSTITVSGGPPDSSVLSSESGISLAEGSDIPLASDSGISLERPNDSGISLAEESSILLSEDSGISLADDAAPVKKGPNKKGGAAAGGGTHPLLDIPLAEDEDNLDTQMEIPAASGADDDFDMEGGGTAVIPLDEEEGSTGDYLVSGSKSDDAFATPASGEVAVEDFEEAEAEEVIGEDDELAEEIIGAEDTDFAEHVDSGESVSELPIARGMAAPVEQDWGAPTFAALALSAVLMIVCGTVTLDMVRNMWHTDVQKHDPLSNAILDAFKN
jgi:hypothetical protein